MVWTYKEIAQDTSRPAASLAGYADLLRGAYAQTCTVSPYIFMTDAERVKDTLAAALVVPAGSAIIYRHFGAPDKREVALALRAICSNRQLQFLIAADIDLALNVEADGVHFPEGYREHAKAFRAAHPHSILTGAAHSQQALEHCAAAGLDAALLSPVFTSASPSAGAALGVDTFTRWAAGAKLPVYALGGVTLTTAPQLLGTPCAGIAGVSAFVVKSAEQNLNAACDLAALHGQGFENGWPESDFTAHIHNSKDDVMGFYKDGLLAGFIIVRTQDDQSEILTVVVGEEMRGQGYGKDIVREGEHAAKRRGADIMFLEVAKDNASGISLYEGLGYMRCGVRKGYYRRAMGRVDAILFQKAITDKK